MKFVRLIVDVQAEEVVSTELGKFQTIRVEPDVFDGHLFKGKGRMFIWFTKDARRLPVQRSPELVEGLRAQIIVGTITAVLAAIERETD